MTREEQISKLEDLLNRITVNRQRPRAAAVSNAGLPETTRRAVAEPREAAEAAQVAAAGEARAELDSITDFELLDEEIIEITAESMPPEAADEVAEAAGAADLESEVVFDEEEEEPPASSRRAKVAAESMDEALAGAAEELEGGQEHEVPVKTPPPESGPQEAAPVQAPPPPPVPQFHRPARPTAPMQDELEAELPQRPAPGSYARPPAPAAAVPAPAPAAPERIEPVATRRAEPPAAEVVSTLGAARRFAPESFLDLLDASLGLGSD